MSWGLVLPSIIISGLFQMFPYGSASVRAAEKAVVDFPQANSKQVSQWLKTADEVVIYAIGGHGNLLVNRQVHIKTSSTEIRVVDLGIDPDQQQISNSLRWGNIPFLQKKSLLAKLENTHFAFLPSDSKLPYGAVVIGLELREKDKTRRWYWEYKNPSKVANGLREFLREITTHAKPDGELRAKNYCSNDGTVQGVELSYVGKDPITLNPARSNAQPVNLIPGERKKISNAPTVWGGVVTGQKDLDASVLVAKGCKEQ